DILLYFPVHEVWKKELFKRISNPIITMFQVHNANVWLQNSNFCNMAERLHDNGYTFDYISNRMIAKLQAEDGALITGKARYKAIVLPEIETIPLETLIQLKDLANKGANIIFEKDIPSDIPGLFDLENQIKRIASVRNEMLQSTSA